MLQVISDLNPMVQVHMCAATLSALLAPLQLIRQARDSLHRRVGYIWVLAMAVTALSSFGIHGFRLIGPFSPIHGLSVLVLYSLVQAIRAARAGDFIQHRKTMESLAVWSLGVAGLFTLMPGRVLNAVLFGSYGPEGFAACVVAAVVFVCFRALRNRLAQGAS